MRKTICILIAVMCLTTVFAAYAETEFILRGGIRFGDDMDTIGSKETWEKNSGFHIFNYKGTLTGIPAMLTYGYDDNHQMISAMYCLNTRYDQDGGTIYAENDAAFDEMLGNLRIKYGTVYLNDPDADVYTDIVLNEYTKYLSSSAASGQANFESISECKSRAAWIVPDGEYYVLIDLRKYEIMQKGNLCYLILLDYCRFTEEEARKQSEIMSEL